MLCKSCGKDLKHKARGLCASCYGVQYRNTHRDESVQYSRQYRKENRAQLNMNQREQRRVNHINTMCENESCTLYLGVHVAERVLCKVFRNVTKMIACNQGYDFICNKGKKIDVKSSCTRVQHGRSNSWAFHIERNTIADFFLCIAFDNRENLNPLHIWLIPAGVINHLKGASISEPNLSKWDEYKLDIDKVTACCDIMKQSNQKKVT